MMLEALRFQSAATCLSWFGARLRLSSAYFQGLARLSLAAATFSMLSGCLVDDPPPYPTAQQTPPRLDYAKASPGLDQVLVTSFPDVVTFEMPVTSEDAGDELVAILRLDYDGQVGDQVSFGHLPPSTLADTSRRVFSLPWVVPRKLDPGCHRLTLRVTHLRNTDRNFTNVLDTKDLAEAYWFANVNVTPENAGSLVDCPKASSGSDSP